MPTSKAKAKAKRSKPPTASKASKKQPAAFKRFSPSSLITALIFVVLFGGLGIFLLNHSRAACGTPEIKSGLSSSWCITDENGSVDASNPVNTNNCNGNANQQWSFTGGALRNTALSGTHCLQPYNNRTATQTPVVMSTCGSEASQNWSNYRGGYKNSDGLCLTEPSGNLGDQLQTRDCAKQGNGLQNDQTWNPGTHPAPTGGGGGGGGNLTCTAIPKYGTAASHPGECADAQTVLSKYNWYNNDDDKGKQKQLSCLSYIYDHESGWSPTAENASGAYGIPQAKPGSKMSSAGPDWQTNAYTQIKWGVSYIDQDLNNHWGHPGTACDAWTFWKANGWYGPEQPANGTIVRYN